MFYLALYKRMTGQFEWRLRGKNTPIRVSNVFFDQRIRFLGTWSPYERGLRISTGGLHTEKISVYFRCIFDIFGVFGDFRCLITENFQKITEKMYNRHIIVIPRPLLYGNSVPRIDCASQKSRLGPGWVLNAPQTNYVLTRHTFIQCQVRKTSIEQEKPNNWKGNT